MPGRKIRERIRCGLKKAAAVTTAVMMTASGIGAASVVPAAAASATVHFGGYAQWPRGGSKTGRFSINGQPALCYQHANASPKYSKTATYAGEYNSAAIRKILYYGFNGPDTSYWGSRAASVSDKARVLTTRALSMAASGHVPDHHYGNDSKTDKYAKAYYYWATARPDPKEGWIVFSNTAPGVHLDTRKNVQVSDTVTARKYGSRNDTLSGTVDTGNSNVIIVNETSGKSGRRVKITQWDKFHLQAAASYTGSISLTNLDVGGGGTYTAQNWTTSRRLQNLTYLTFSYKSNATSLRASFRGTTQVSASKKDITGTEEVKGAKMRITDASGGTVAEWTSDGSNHVVKGLVSGSKYVLTEIQAPSGYEKAQSITFTAGSDRTVTMKDERKKTQVRIRKTGVEDGSKPAPGNVYRITGMTGIGKSFTDEKTTDANGYATFTLESGSYVMKEAKSTSDYYKDTSEYKITVTDDMTVTINGKVTKAAEYYSVKDKERWHVDIVLGKKDISTLVPLSGATYRLAGTSDAKNLIEKYSTSDSNGTIRFNDIETGTYDLTETTAPKGYHKLDRTLKVKVTHAAGQKTAVATVTDPDKTAADEDAVSGTTLYDTGLYSFKLRKKDARTGNSIKGAKFILSGTSSFGKALTGTTVSIGGKSITGIAAESKDGGFVTFAGLEPGSYQLYEYEAPKGYHSDTAAHWVSISYRGEVTSDLTQNAGDAKFTYSFEDSPATTEVPVKKKWVDKDATKRKLPVIHLDATQKKAAAKAAPSLFSRLFVMKAAKKEYHYINITNTGGGYFLRAPVERSASDGFRSKNGGSGDENGDIKTPAYSGRFRVIYNNGSMSEHVAEFYKPGYHLVGMYENGTNAEIYHSDGGNQLVATSYTGFWQDENYNVTPHGWIRHSDVNAHIVWAPNTHTVYFNGNGATGGNTSPYTVTFDSGYNLPGSGFTRDGYEFVGWNDRPDGGGQWWSSGKWVWDNDFTVYAIWRRSTSGYTVRDVFVDDKDNEKAVLGTKSMTGNIGSTVNGGDAAGKDTTPDKYHKGYVYTGATEATVAGDGSTVVSRRFKAVTKIDTDSPGGTFESSINGGPWTQHTNSQTEILPYGSTVRIRKANAKAGSGYVVSGVKEDGNEISDFQGVYGMTVDTGGKTMQITTEKDTRNRLTQNYVTTEGVSWQKVADEDGSFTLPQDADIIYGTDSAYVTKHLKAGTYKANAAGLGVTQPASSGTREVLAKLPNWIDRKLPAGQTGTMTVGGSTYVTHDASWADTKSANHFDTDKYGNIPGYWEKIDDSTYQYTFSVYDRDVDWNVYEEKIDGYTGDHLKANPYELANGSSEIPEITNSQEGKYGAFSVKKITQKSDGTDYPTGDTFSFIATLTDENGNAIRDTKGAVTYGDATFSNGIARFTLKKNETKKFTNIPAGWHYRVEEIRKAGYPTTLVNGTKGYVASGTVTAGGQASVTYTNRISPPKAGELYTAQVVKKLADGTKDDGRKYRFHVHFRNVRILNMENAPETASGTPLDIAEDGSSDISFDLAANSAMKFINLNEEAEMTVTEEGGSYVSSYIVTKSGVKAESGEQNEMNRQLSTGYTKVAENGSANDLVFTFTNRPVSYQKLTVEKRINGGDADRTFSMLAEFSGLKTTDRIVTGSESLIPDDAGKISYRFALKPGEKREFSHIPAGAQYRVTESAEERYAPSYKVTSSSGGTVAKATDSAGVQKPLATALEQLETGSDDTVTFTNAYSYSFGIRKRNQDNAALSGAEFILRKVTVNADRSTSVDAGTKAVTDAHGFAGWKNLKAGMYVLSETKTPTGYSVAPSRIIRIDNDGTAYEMTQLGKSASLQNAEKALTDAVQEADDADRALQELRGTLAAAQKHAELVRKAADAKKKGSADAAQLLKDLVNASSDADTTDYENATADQLEQMATDAQNSIATIQQEITDRTASLSAANTARDSAQKSYDAVKKEEDAKGEEAMTVSDIAKGVISGSVMAEWTPAGKTTVDGISYTQFDIENARMQKLPATGVIRKAAAAFAVTTLVAAAALAILGAAERRRGRKE